MKRLVDRRHNDRAFQYYLNRHNISGTKLDYIDKDKADMMDQMERDHEKKKEKMAKIHEDLRKMREKNG